MNTGKFTKTYVAGAAVAKRRIVKFGADADHVIQGAAAADALIGVSTDIDAAIGERCDVYHDGIQPVAAGAAVGAGKLVTADAAGKAVEAADGNRIVGIALSAAGAADELVEVLIIPGIS